MIKEQKSINDDVSKEIAFKILTDEIKVESITIDAGRVSHYSIWTEVPIRVTGPTIITIVIA